MARSPRSVTRGRLHRQVNATMSEKPVRPEVRRFDANTGARIYRITCDAFPGFAANIYLLLEAGPPTLIDTGSGFWDANKQLVTGIEKVRSEFGESIALTDIRRIIITHGHIDHFGGLAFLHDELPDAEIAIHELDVRILTAYDERVAVAKKAFRRFLEQVGVEPELLEGFMDIYGYSKQNVHNLPVARTLVDNQELDGLRFIHTPGHCPGQVCIALGDVLFSADHVLPEISPHQAPESIMPYTGLGHYLESLDKIGRMGGFDLALGGHGEADSRRLQAGQRDPPGARAQVGKGAHHHSRSGQAADDQRHFAADVHARRGLPHPAGPGGSGGARGVSVPARQAGDCQLRRVPARRKPADPLRVGVTVGG